MLHDLFTHNPSRQKLPKGLIIANWRDDGSISQTAAAHFLGSKTMTEKYKHRHTIPPFINRQIELWNCMSVPFSFCPFHTVELDRLG